VFDDLWSEWNLGQVKTLKEFGSKYEMTDEETEEMVRNWFFKWYAPKRQDLQDFGEFKSYKDVMEDVKEVFYKWLLRQADKLKGDETYSGTNWKEMPGMVEPLFHKWDALQGQKLENFGKNIRLRMIDYFCSLKDEDCYMWRAADIILHRKLDRITCSNRYTDSTGFCQEAREILHDDFARLLHYQLRGGIMDLAIPLFYQERKKHYDNLWNSIVRLMCIKEPTECKKLRGLSAVQKKIEVA